MSDLIKTQRLLEFDYSTDRVTGFVQRDEERPDHFLVAIDLATPIWMEMGRPTTITVTIENTDTLNVEPPQAEGAKP